MEYRRDNSAVYVRFDKGDEILSGILQVCQHEKILSATYSGIGACKTAVVATYIPEKDDFVPHEKHGMLELLSLTGNISSDEHGEIFEHTHAVFSFLEGGEVSLFGGHLKKAVVLYTAEICIRPASFVIGRKIDSATGITVWDLQKPL